MDQKGREALELPGELAAPGGPVPAQEPARGGRAPAGGVVKVMTPTSEQGRKAYQSLVELGFVRPYGPLHRRPPEAAAPAAQGIVGE